MVLLRGCVQLHGPPSMVVCVTLEGMFCPSGFEGVTALVILCKPNPVVLMLPIPPSSTYVPCTAIFSTSPTNNSHVTKWQESIGPGQHQ